MAELMLVPEVAAGATEVVVSEWLVAVGDVFAAGDAVAVIETEKAIVEVEAETDATLLRALVTPGSQVEVGAPMALLGSTAELDDDLDAALAELGARAAPHTPVERRDVPASEPEPASEPADDGNATPGAAPGTARTFVSPIARRLLKEAGVAPADVTGTGPGGRIVRRDVESHLRERAAVPQTPTTPDPAVAPGASPVAPGAAATWTDVPHDRMRRAIARHLTSSKQEVPHFYVKRTAVIDRLLALRADVNEVSEVRTSVNDYVLKAVAVAHRAVPEANAIWTDDATRRFDGVDVSVAIASQRGLVTPVVRSVDQQPIGSISSAVRRYVEQADAGRLQQKDLEGGSITVTNLGMYGVEEFSAIINPPQSAILAVGAGVPAVRVVDGEVATVTAMSLVLSVDHRVIDGALAARWMAALVEALEQPVRLLVP